MKINTLVAAFFIFSLVACDNQKLEKENADLKTQAQNQQKELEYLKQELAQCQKGANLSTEENKFSAGNILDALEILAEAEKLIQTKTASSLAEAEQLLKKWDALGIESTNLQTLKEQTLARLKAAKAK